MFSRERRVAGFDPELHAALEAEAEGYPGKHYDGGCQHVDTGIRVGTPAATTRGFREPEVKALAGWMCDILSDIGNPSVIARVREQVTQLCTRFPVYRG